MWSKRSRFLPPKRRVRRVKPVATPTPTEQPAPAMLPLTHVEPSLRCPVQHDYEPDWNGSSGWEVIA